MRQQAWIPAITPITPAAVVCRLESNRFRVPSHLVPFHPVPFHPVPFHPILSPRRSDGAAFGEGVSWSLAVTQVSLADRTHCERLGQAPGKAVFYHVTFTSALGQHTLIFRLRRGLTTCPRWRQPSSQLGTCLEEHRTLMTVHFLRV